MILSPRPPALHSEIRILSQPGSQASFNFLSHNDGFFTSSPFRSSVSAESLNPTRSRIDSCKPPFHPKHNASKGGQCFLERQEFAAYQKHGLAQVVTKTNAEWATSGDLSVYLKQEKQEAMSLDDRLATWAIGSEQCNKHHFIWTIHHALYDGWPTSIVISQVHRAYHYQDWEHETSFKFEIRRCKR